MTYLALARKWRPKTFSEVVGQEHVVKALSNALQLEKVHHALLFTGTRGVGKTTLARIFAKSLNCLEGTSAEPCQQCSVCLSVDEGKFVDLIEVDAASRTKVDDTRELLENVQYAPTTGRYKVYLIDEVHMLSGHSFNALLKTLEEPPEHVKFLFATTDPQKLPVTVLSRCLQFNLRAMRPEQIENQLIKILSSEQIQFDAGGVKLLSRAANGSMRDGLSLLDQAIAQGEGAVVDEDVRSMLGSIENKHIDQLLALIQSANADDLVHLSLEMEAASVDFSSALDELLIALHQVSLLQLTNPSQSQTHSNEFSAEDGSEHVQSFANTVSEQEVQLYYQIGLAAKRDLPYAPTPRVGFEIAILRMLAFTPSSEGIDQSSSEPTKSVPNTSATAPEGEMQSGASPRPVESPQPVESLRASVSPQPVMSPQPIMSPQPVVSPQPGLSSHADDSAQISEAPNSDSQPRPQAAQPGLVAKSLAENNEWGAVIEQSGLVGMAKELAMHSACERMGDASVVLMLAPQSKHLLKPERIAQIESAVSDLMKRPMSVEISVEQSDRETPAECLQRLGIERIQETKANLQTEPGLNTLMNEFGVQIDEESIRPPGS